MHAPPRNEHTTQLLLTRCTCCTPNDRNLTIGSYRKRGLPRFVVCFNLFMSTIPLHFTGSLHTKERPPCFFCCVLTQVARFFRHFVPLLTPRGRYYYYGRVQSPPVRQAGGQVDAIRALFHETAVDYRHNCYTNKTI